MCHVWYNMREINPVSAEQLDIVTSMAEELVKLIENEVKAGITYDRIVIGKYMHFSNSELHLSSIIIISTLQVDFLWVVRWLCTWDTDFYPKLVVYLLSLPI